MKTILKIILGILIIFNISCKKAPMDPVPQNIIENIDTNTINNIADTIWYQYWITTQVIEFNLGTYYSMPNYSVYFVIHDSITLSASQKTIYHWSDEIQGEITTIDNIRSLYVNFYAQTVDSGYVEMDIILCKIRELSLNDSTYFTYDTLYNRISEFYTFGFPQ